MSLRPLLPLALAALTALPTAADAAPQAHISMISAQTGKVRTVRSAPGKETFYAGPVWAADSKSVYVLRELYRTEGVDVLRIAASTGKATQLDRYRGAEYAEIAPEHDRVAYSTDPDDEEGTTETVRVAPIGTGAGAKVLLPDGHEVTDLSFSPDGKLLAVGHRRFSDKQPFITIHDSTTLAAVRTVETDYALFDDDSWLPDSSALFFRAFSEEDNLFVRLDLGPGTLTTIETSPFEDVDGHAVGPGGISALGARRSVSVHPSGNRYAIPRRNHFGGAIDFSPDATTLAYGYTTNGRALGPATVVLRDLATGERRHTVAAGDGEPISLSYSPTGRRVIVLVALRQVVY